MSQACCRPWASLGRGLEAPVAKATQAASGSMRSCTHSRRPSPSWLCGPRPASPQPFLAGGGGGGVGAGEFRGAHVGRSIPRPRAPLLETLQQFPSAPEACAVGPRGLSVIISCLSRSPRSSLTSECWSSTLQPHAHPRAFALAVPPAWKALPPDRSQARAITSFHSLRKCCHLSKGLTGYSALYPRGARPKSLPYCPLDLLCLTCHLVSLFFLLSVLLSLAGSFSEGPQGPPPHLLVFMPLWNQPQSE